MTDDLLVRLRRQVDESGGRMLVIPRTDIAELLRRIQPDAAQPAGSVTLADVPRDIERLADAAWTTATDPSYVMRHGPWHEADDEKRAHHRDAAARTIARLIATTE